LVHSIYAIDGICEPYIQKNIKKESILRQGWRTFIWILILPVCINYTQSQESITGRFSMEILFAIRISST
jgi:hypothetical protein